MSTEKPALPIGAYYRPELDVVRFLAFFLVFLSHNLPRSATPRIAGLFGVITPIFVASTNACTFGVSLFLTLSAFLIFELLLREKKATGSVSVKEFYFRRILRIWPLYYTGLAIGLLYAFTPLGSRSGIAGFGWYAIFMGSWHAATHGWLDNPMFVLWTVSIEEQFYAVAPWLPKCFNRKSLAGISIGIVVVSNLWICHLRAEGVDGDRIWANSIVQFQCFAIGILLCLILGGRLPRMNSWRRLLLLAGAATCWIFAAYKPMHADFGIVSESGVWPYFTGYLFASLGSVLVLVAFLGIDRRLLPGWAVSLGRISFGLYVFHVLAHDLVTGVLRAVPLVGLSRLAVTICATFGLTVLMARISYRNLEMPFLRLKARHALIQSQPL